MPSFVSRPSTIRSLSLVDIPQSSVVFQQMQLILELNIKKFVFAASFLYWKIRFGKTDDYFFWFSVGIGDGRFSGRIKIFEVNCGQVFSEFRHVGRKDRLCFWTKSSRILSSTRRSGSRNTKSRKRIGFLEEDGPAFISATTFGFSMFMIQHGIALICFPSLCLMIRSMFIIRIDTDQSESSTAKFWRQTWENRNAWSVKRDQALKEEKYLLPVERIRKCSRGDQCSFRHKSNGRIKSTPKGPVRRIRFTRTALHQANIKKKSPLHGKIQFEILISKVPTVWNERTDLQKRLQNESDVSAEMSPWICPENLQALKERQSYILFAFWGVDFGGRIHNKFRGMGVCCRFRSEHTHRQQERLEQSRIGDCERKIR